MLLFRVHENIFFYTNQSFRWLQLSTEWLYVLHTCECTHTQLANGRVDWCNANRDGGHGQTVLCWITALLLARHSVWILLTHFSCSIHCSTLNFATSVHLAQGSLKLLLHWVDRSLWHLLHLSFSLQEVYSPLRDEWQLQTSKEGKKAFILLNLYLKRKCKVST